jgi:hypothetical protein
MEKHKKIKVSDSDHKIKTKQKDKSKSQLISEKVCHNSVQNLSSTRSLSENRRISLHNSVILRVTFRGNVVSRKCKTHGLRVCENSVMRCTSDEVYI